MLQSDLAGQDIHYSQYYLSSINVNPALTGIFNGDERYSASMRDQWRSVPVPWFTFSMAYDRKIYPKKSNKHFFGAGLFYNYDRQGDSRINLNNLNFSASYNHLLSKRNIITLGGLIGYSSRGFNPSTLSWDKQWNGVAYDPSLSTGELFNIDRFNFLETSLGINFRHQKNERTKFDFGIGGFHLTKPKAVFTRTGEVTSTSSQVLPMRLVYYGQGSLKLSERMDLRLDALYQTQNSYSEMLFGGYLNFYLNQKRGKKTNLHLGVGYRTSKALFPKIAIGVNNIFVAFSYDIDMSEFNQHTNGRGGPEIHFNYIITHVKPMGKFKNCPIF